MSNLERYNECCGIVKIKKSKFLESDSYVVFFNDNDYVENNELGEAIGKGKSKEEALIQAIKILSENIYNQSKMWTKIYELGEEISCIDLFKVKTPVIPIKDLNGLDESYNSSVFLMDDGEACLGIL